MRIIVVKQIGSLFVVALLLAGCSQQYTGIGENRYLQCRNGVNLVVPPPLTDTNISHFYDLPNQNLSEPVSIAPPNIIG
jgi:uncharacterized lipoprotein